MLTALSQSKYLHTRPVSIQIKCISSRVLRLRVEVEPGI